MMPKGLPQYQSVQKSVSELDNKGFLEKIIGKAALYDIAFLQNRAMMETILTLPDQSIDEKTILKFEKLFLWLYQTQEEAKLS